MSNDETATPLASANVCVKDGAIQLTMLAGDKTAMLTVRGKDHDLTSAECRELAKALDEAAKLTALATVMAEVERLTAERDKARRMFCVETTATGSAPEQQVAVAHGWLKLYPEETAAKRLESQS